MIQLKRLFDHFTLALLCTVALASLFPCHGTTAKIVNVIADIAIGLLFFLHGAKLSRTAIIAGATHWRLHVLVFLCTFVAFPLLGLTLQPIFAPFTTPALYAGVLFLCTLPSTVQSSIAFTSIAKGNVPAAVCSASASSLAGIFITPVLVSLVVSQQAHPNSTAWHTVGSIVMQLLVPFLAGQWLRPLIGRAIDRHHGTLKFVDQGSILLVVYSAFSAAVNENLWQHVPLVTLAALLLVNAVLLGAALAITGYVSKRLGFSRADQITIIFCGSKKSLATGIPMAKIIFAAHTLGATMLPLMLFHQMQLMVCAALAQRWGAQTPENNAIA